MKLATAARSVRGASRHGIDRLVPADLKLLSGAMTAKNPYLRKATLRKATKQPKASIALRLDADVLKWFKALGPGYQTRINAVSRAFTDASI